MHCRKHDLNLDLFVQLILRALGRGYTVGSAAKVNTRENSKVLMLEKNKIEAENFFS